MRNIGEGKKGKREKKKVSSRKKVEEKAASPKIIDQ